MQINRQRHIALLLVLLLGHAALTFHVSTHIPVDPSNCEFCAGNADPGHAIAFAISEVKLSTAVEVSFASESFIVRPADFVAYRERAPPTLS